MNKEDNKSKKDEGKKSEKSVSTGKEHKSDIARKGGESASKEKDSGKSGKH